MSLGIDVSHHNGKLDWSAIAAAGVMFAYAKASEGDTFKDPQFATNVLGAVTEDIRFGAYHFFRPEILPARQVDAFCEALMNEALVNEVPMRMILPPALDLEETFPIDKWNGITPAYRASCALQWLEGVEQRLGVRPILYVRAGWLDRMIPDVTELLPYELWIAHYTDLASPRLPAGWTKWKYWQYTDKGTLPGVAGTFDLDRRAAEPAPRVSS